MIYSISKRFLNQIMSRQQVCIAILGNFDRVAQPVGDLLNTDKSSRCEQRRKSRSHSLDGQPFHSVGCGVVLKGAPHVIAITVRPALKLLGMEKITRTGSKRREVALKEFSGLLRHRNHTLSSILDPKVAERRVRPGQVTHAQEPLPEIDPTWQCMVNLSSPQPEVKTENQKEFKMILLGSRDESVALLVSREPTIRSRFRLFDHDIDSGIVRNLSRAVRPPKQACNARKVGGGRVIRHTGALGVVPFLKVSGGNCAERFCDTCHKGFVDVTMTLLGRCFPLAPSKLFFKEFVQNVPERLRSVDEWVHRNLAGRTNRLRKIDNRSALGVSERDKMPLAAVHLHVIILRASHVHVRHTGRSPSVPRFAIADASLGGLVHDLGVSQICVTNRKFFCRHMLAQQSNSENGVLAQLVERLNGIEEVRGSSPLDSKPFDVNDLRAASDLVSTVGLNDDDALAKAAQSTSADLSGDDEKTPWGFLPWHPKADASQRIICALRDACEPARGSALGAHRHSTLACARRESA